MSGSHGLGAHAERQPRACMCRIAKIVTDDTRALIFVRGCVTNGPLGLKFDGTNFADSDQSDLVNVALRIPQYLRSTERRMFRCSAF